MPAAGKFDPEEDKDLVRLVVFGKVCVCGGPPVSPKL
jgi:hypothetical protein